MNDCGADPLYGNESIRAGQVGSRVAPPVPLILCAVCCSCLARNWCGVAALPTAELAHCCRGPRRAFLAPTWGMFGPGGYTVCLHGVANADPRRPRVGADCRAPPCGYCLPFPEDVNQEA